MCTKRKKKKHQHDVHTVLIIRITEKRTKKKQKVALLFLYFCAGALFRTKSERYQLFLSGELKRSFFPGNKKGGIAFEVFPCIKNKFYTFELY